MRGADSSRGDPGGRAARAARPGEPRELSVLVSEWPEVARDEYEERAAILRYDARMAPERAERAAEHIVRDRWRRGLL